MGFFHKVKRAFHHHSHHHSHHDSNPFKHIPKPAIKIPKPKPPPPPRKIFKAIKKKAVQKGDAIKKDARAIHGIMKKGAKSTIKATSHDPILKTAAKVANKAIQEEKKLDNKSGGAITAAAGILTPEARATWALADVTAKSISTGKFNPKDLQQVSDSLMAPAIAGTELLDKGAAAVGVPENVREVTTELAKVETKHVVAEMMTPNVGHMIDTVNQGRLDKTFLEAGKPLNAPIAVPLAAYSAFSGGGTKAIRKRKAVIRENEDRRKEYRRKLALIDEQIKHNKEQRAKREAMIRKLFQKWVNEHRHRIPHPAVGRTKAEKAQKSQPMQNHCPAHIPLPH